MIARILRIGIGHRAGCNRSGRGSAAGRAVLRSTNGARVRTRDSRAILRRAAGLATRFRGHSSARAARRRDDRILVATSRRSQGCSKVLFARALLISRGDFWVFVERPISGAFMAITAILLVFAIWNAWHEAKQKKAEALAALAEAQGTA